MYSRPSTSDRKRKAIKEPEAVVNSNPSPQNGKFVSDVEYNPNFWVVQRGQLTPSKLAKASIDATASTARTAGEAAHSAAYMARGISNAAPHASST
jgi:hypothetical protein